VSTPSQPRGPGDPASPPGLVEHYFRHEYGRLVAILSRRVGLPHLEAVEDAVQGALLAALTAWAASGIPADPSAWLYRVAHNELLGVLRKGQGQQRILDGAADQGADGGEDPISPAFAGEVRDELLRMLFVCCDDSLPAPVSRYIDSSSAWNPSSKSSCRCSRRKPNSLPVRTSLFINHCSCFVTAIGGFHRIVPMLASVAKHDHGLHAPSNAIRVGSHMITYRHQQKPVCFRRNST